MRFSKFKNKTSFTKIYGIVITIILLFVLLRENYIDRIKDKLGNSITSQVDWGELLGVNSIANRGVGDDVTEGYLNRLNNFYVISVIIY